MGLILLHIRLKTSAFFSWTYNRSGLILSVLYLLSVFYLLFILSNIIGQLEGRVTATGIKKVLLSAILLLTLVRKFVPQYVPFAKPLLKHHPRSSLYRYCFNLLDEILCFSFLKTVLFILLLPHFFSFFSTYETFVWLIWVVAAVVTRRLLHCFIEQRTVKSPAYLLIPLFFLFAAIYFYSLYFSSQTVATVASGYLLLACILGYVQEEVVSEYEPGHQQTGIAVQYKALNILLNTGPVRVSLMVALIIKGVFLSLLTVRLRTKGLGELGFIALLFSSPAFIFTYCFNNTWGMLRNYWYTIDRCNPDGRRIFSFQLGIMVFPLMADCFMTLAFYLLNKTLGPVILVSYFSTAILLCVLSFYWSLWFPFHVSKGFSASVTTSVAASVSTILLCTLMYLTEISNAFYLLTIIYLLVALLLFLNLRSFYNEARQGIYAKLFTR